MALYGAFSSSILGMMSQSYAMANISNNIANMNTGGYRATETRFSTLVSSPLFEQSDLGGLKPSDIRLMDVQGNMESSSRDLDIAINGTGFFMVSPTMNGTTRYYTRDGSLQLQTGDAVPMIDASGNPVLDASGAAMTTREGYLADKNGYFLLGWPVGPDGTVQATGAPQPMRVDQYAFADAGRATSEGSLLLNIPSTAEVGQSFNYDMTVYDSAGKAHTATATFTKTSTPNVWNVDVHTGDATDLVTLGPPSDFALDTSVTGGLTSIDATSGTISVLNAAGLPSAHAFLGLSAGETITLAGTANNNRTFTIQSVSADGSTITVDPTTPLTLEGGNIANVQYSAPGAVVQMQFTGKGYVNTPGALGLNVAWGGGGGGGATAATTAMSLDVSRMTQFSSDYLVNTYWQNGYGPAYLNGIAFDSNGYVLGQFGDASDRPLYRVALASFTNAAALEQHNGNLYTETEASGQPQIFAAGENEWATIAPNTREIANVDVADEFSKMIMTQHAYTAASKVFITVDEMTETARDLKRG